MIENVFMEILYNAHFLYQEKKKREEADPKLQELMNTFSEKDAILEQGIAKAFEQSVVQNRASKL